MNPGIEQDWAERPPTMPDPFAVDDDPRRTVRVLESDADVREAMRDFHRPRKPDIDSRDDGARLPFDPDASRREARRAALDAARNALASLERSLECLAIDRPALADEYQGGPPADKHRRGINLLAALEDYVATVVDLADQDG